MANKLLTVRVPPYIITFVEQLASKTNQTKTDTVISLLESSTEFKDFQREQGIPQREPTVGERLADIQAQLEALEEASNPPADFFILRTVEKRLKDILDRADNEQSGYNPDSFSTGLGEIRALLTLIQQRHS